MQLLSFLVSLLATAISVISAYISWRVTHPIPKLLARPTTVINPPNLDVSGSCYRTLVLFHVQITNLSTFPVQLVDYKLEARMLNGFRTQLSAESRISVEIPMTYEDKGFMAKFETSNFMLWPPRAVEYGRLQMGFLPFASELVIEARDVHSYRLTLYDVFDNKYEAAISQEEVNAWDHGRRGASIGFFQIMEHAGVILDYDDPRAPVPDRVSSQQD